jgi:hypothetical protein
MTRPRPWTGEPTAYGMLLAVSVAGILAGLAVAGDVWRRVRWFRRSTREVRAYADFLSRTAGQRPEVVAVDVAWRLRQILGEQPPASARADQPEPMPAPTGDTG